MIERKTRSDKGGFQLKPRDIHVLSWVGQMYTVRFDVLRKLLTRDMDEARRQRSYQHHLERAQEAGKELEIPDEQQLAESTVYQVVRRWKNAGLVEAVQIVGGEPIYIWLTQKGLESVGLSFRSLTPSLSLIKHMHAVTKVRLRLEELHPTSKWVCERELTTTINRLDERERKKIDHIPDGELELEDAKKLVIEVELSKKAEQRIIKIMLDLRKRYEMDTSSSSAIYYFVNDTTRDTIERLGWASLKAGQAPFFTKEELRVLSLKGGYN